MKKLTSEETIFTILLAIVGIVFLVFYRRYNELNCADIDDHRRLAMMLFQNSIAEMRATGLNIPIHSMSYPLYHIVVKFLGVILGDRYHWSSYIVLSIVNVLSIYLFRKMALLICEAETERDKLWVDIMCILGIFFVVARSPLTEWRFYAIQCAPNPVHNPTILFVRPFAIITVILFATILIKSEKQQKYTKEIILFGITTFLSVLAKPNFVITFFPGMGIIVLIKMLMKKQWKLGKQILGSVVPSLILLMAQYIFATTYTNAMGMHFKFGGFSGLGLREIVSVSIATFPVVIILFSKKAFQDNYYYKIGLGALLFGWVQMFFLSTGFTGDFSWGYDLAVQFSTLISLSCAVKYSVPKWRRWLGYTVFGYQAICGIMYFMQVFKWGQFLI